MQFNSHATNQDIVSEINDICNSDANSYPIASKTRRVNQALDRFFTLAFSVNKRGSFDDLNQTTAPLESINLVSGTEKYALDTFTSEVIATLRVEILDSNSNGLTLERLDRDSVQGVSLPQFNSVGGTPQYWDKLGKYIYLYPKPNYNKTSGLSLYIQRNKSAFVTTDTTKVAGIPTIFHPYLCRYASLPYLIEFQKPQKNDVAAQVRLDEEAIIDYFNHLENFHGRFEPSDNSGGGARSGFIGNGGSDSNE